ncbi:MAG: putative toxin-antitoxin system toxin component, PIN family [Nitrosopumilales archaeon CG15_BIG_FIL_POST_REV_8_21_14_020_37_12]|nr:MAG: putative toxin-antitoxin system toxin component, PIN family [Nitrosopumilales archaeon CG15_BIG_FIL_POST_REV_8_21_14_020_37_12]
MYRVVLDTNVLISAVIRNGNPRNLLKNAINDKKYVLVTSDKILNEMSGVLHRPKFKMTEDEIDEIVFTLISSSEIQVVTSKFKAVKDDPDDDIIINTAYDGEADYVVSGDDDLLRMKKFKNIQIVTVTEMLKIL